MLYVISDFIFFVVFYIVRYRKQLVLENLKLVFPEKSEKELLKIRRKFFHHFVDIFVEMIKTFTISNKQIAKHYKFKNIDLVNAIASKGKSVIIIGSHYGNWEWVISMNLTAKYPGYATYTEINNSFLEKKIKTTRERFGAKMVLKKDTSRNMARNISNKRVGLYGLLSDQSPQLHRAHYWTEFLGVRVPIHTGAEMLAKRYNMAVVYMQVERLKRGYYEVTFETLTETPKDYKDYEITDMFLEKTEKQIRTKPAYYFWTHNRFKHAGKG